MKYSPLLLLLPLFTLAACDSLPGLSGSDSSFPKRAEERREEERGRITGEGGLIVAGGPAEEESAGSNPLGVNSFLWRASLDTLAFMPLASADPFGGVIITDWYEDPNARGERFKINLLILDRTLRADGIKASIFKQTRDVETNEWQDAKVEDAVERQLEDSILTRARQLRIKQGD